MFGSLTKLFDNNEKQINKVQPVIDKINGLEDQFSQLKDEELAQKTQEFKDRYSNGETLDDLLPEAFANVREAAKRSIGKRHYDVQLVGGIVLHQGKIAEMKTGEGKTLVATLALYLNALTGQGSHLVTANGYLAQLGMGWNGPIYHKLGMSVSAIDHDLSVIYEPEFTDPDATDDRLAHLKKVSRRQAYAADILYATNNELGFDYLRDNMVQDLKDMVQRPLSFAIVDEVDSILIDEARTPLIISAPADESNELYIRFAKLVKQLPQDEIVIDEKSRSASLTEAAADKMEKWLGVDNMFDDFTLTHHLNQALRGQWLYHRDKDYVVRDGEVIIVDEFTGRLMPGRRYSEGIHQAIEAKEAVTIQKETRTLATITFQNYFRIYKKLSGMTGTAETEAEEFFKIYKLEVVAIPTNKPMIRQDMADLVYKSQKAKFSAIVEDTIARHKAGQPVLVGTTSVAKNEVLSEMLVKQRIPHEVLNAKNHLREAEIIAKAGQKGAITIATNMAGRGTDIQLAESVADLGGLHVIGTERHESRRIDNQLRGRAGRQGDPGSTRFYVALDDDLMRLFGGERIASLMDKLNLPDDMPIENALVTRSIESSQVKVEGHNFDSRKNVVEYDDVINKQREIIYARRRSILASLSRLRQADQEDILADDPNFTSADFNFEANHYVQQVLTQAARNIVLSQLSDHGIDQQGLVAEVQAVLPLTTQAAQNFATSITELDNHEDATKSVEGLFSQAWAARQKQLGDQQFAMLMHLVILSAMDRQWMDHIDVIDSLRAAVALQAHGQRDPLVAFKNEAYQLFERLMGSIDYEVAHQIFKVELIQPQPVINTQEVHQELPTGSVTAAIQADALTPGQSETGLDPAVVSKLAGNIAVSRDGKPAKASTVDKSTLGRNEPCWCGSGKKYKNCHWPN